MGLKRIIMHWSAGGPVPNRIDLRHYHFIIDTIGKIHKGLFKPEDNINCYDGCYCAHTGGGNTGSIGVAMSGMLGFKNKNVPYKFPITQRQLEAYMCFVAGLCKDYNLPIGSTTVMTHYEFGLKHPHTSSKGKIDIIHLPPYPEVRANEIGDFMRQKVLWYYKRGR